MESELVVIFELWKNKSSVLEKAVSVLCLATWRTFLAFSVNAFTVQLRSELKAWHLCKGHKRFNILCCDLTIHFRVRWISLVWEMFHINIGRKMIRESLWALKKIFFPKPVMANYFSHGCEMPVISNAPSYPLLFRINKSMVKIRDHMLGPSKCHIPVNLTFLLCTASFS